MYLRDAPTLTLDRVFADLDVPASHVEAERGDQIKVSGDGMTIEVTPTDGERVEISLDDEGWTQVGGLLQIPDAFAKRLPASTKTNLVNDLLRQVHKGARLTYTQPEADAEDPSRSVGRSRLLSIRDPRQLAFDPRATVEVAQRVVGERAPVISIGHDLTAFAFEAVAYDGHMAELGDPAVGDITQAGLRFGQNLRQNLAPTVARYSYRLVCTNGMEVPRVADYKVDARGKTLDAVMAELEEQAQLAFSAVERDVEAFYAMREERVANPERTINRLAIEQDLSDRVRTELIDLVPSIVDEQGVATMFDLVNLVTNLANSERASRGTRLVLERFGGSMVSSHVDRCVACQSSLTH